MSRDYIGEAVKWYDEVKMTSPNWLSYLAEKEANPFYAAFDDGDYRGYQRHKCVLNQARHFAEGDGQDWRSIRAIDVRARL